MVNNYTCNRSRLPLETLYKIVWISCMYDNVKMGTPSEIQELIDWYKID